jgi:hypothetical protein
MPADSFDSVAQHNFKKVVLVTKLINLWVP